MPQVVPLIAAALINAGGLYAVAGWALVVATPPYGPGRQMKIKGAQ